jgi:hypothetical protein
VKLSRAEVIQRRSRRTETKDAEETEMISAILVFVLRLLR